MENEWHLKPAERVLEALRTGTRGLSNGEALKRLQENGPNQLPEQPGRSLIKIALDQILNPIIYILIAAAALSIALDDIVDAVVILAVVVLNGVIGFTQEAKAEAAIMALRKLLPLMALVIRDGAEKQINAEEIVPGDIVLLLSGQRVPADVRLWHAKQLQVDQSMLTGESIPAVKTADVLAEPEAMIDRRTNMAYMGSSITSGRATAIVVATGLKTELGHISQEVWSAEPVKTPLEARMTNLSHVILFAVAAFGVVGFAVGAALGENLLVLLLTLVALAVAAVPEGLPVATTIALSVAVKRMTRENAIIRYLPAIETLGSCTTIGSDKTGTLTRNEMNVQQVWAGERVYDINGSGYDPGGDILERSVPGSLGSNEALEWTLRVGLLCNESYLAKEDGRWVALGDPTETALIVSARRAGVDEGVERESYPQSDILPFESERQYMATIHSNGEETYLLVKGSSEAVLSLSNAGLGDGPVPLDKQGALAAADTMAGQGLRVLAMARRYMPVGVSEITHDDVKELTFLGLQGMMDPPRPEAIEAVANCRASGLRVIMITGDNELTALAIAKSMGIVGSEPKALTGRDVEAMSAAELEVAVREVPVFARVSPQHKLRLVQALIANGEVVAVTGDGVNDAPALKAAHIGVAMGITGTDVAKEASDMVVVDDNFASIYRAIINGRVAFDNLRKVTFFLLSSGLGGVIAVMATIFTRFPLIFLPVQLLWINLVTNGLQDVALAFDPAEEGVEERPPRPPQENILNRTLLVRLVIIGLIMGAASFGVFAAGIIAGVSEEKARTVALTTIVFAQFFNVFISRSEVRSVFRQKVTNNRFLFFSMVTAFLAQLAFIYAAPLQAVFKTRPLGPSDWLTVIALSFTVVIGSEIHKFWVRRSA